MPHLRRIVAAISVAGVVLLAGCTGGTGTADPTVTPTPGGTSPAASPSSEPDTTAEPTQAPGTTTTPGTEPTRPPADGERTKVSPFIAYAGPGTDARTIEVAGFVPEVIEEGGTCTATIPETGMSVTAPAYPDASSTSCGLLVLPTAPAGQTVVLTYSSEASTGTSGPVQVTS